jgi:HEAT repeat protein
MVLPARRAAVKPLAVLFLLTAILPANPPDIAAPTTAQCTDILQQALTNRNPDTRVQGVVALSLASDRNTLLPLLVKMVDDKDVPVRIAVVSSLADVKNKATIEALHKMLKDAVPEVSFAAAKALWGLNDHAGELALLSVVEGESKTASGYVTAEMRQAMRMMHTPTTTFLFAVRQGVGFIPVPGLGQGITSMQALLTDPGISGRAAAVLLLSKDKDPVLLPALRDALHDKNWTVRAAAVHAIAVRDDPALRKDLAPLLQDEKEGVRLRTAAGYLRLSSVQASAAAGRPAAKK